MLYGDRRLAVTLAVLALSGASLATHAGDKRPVSVVVKEGYVSADVPLFDVNPGWGSLEFVITNGEGQFADSAALQRAADLQDGKVLFPPMEPGRLFGESFLDLRSDEGAIVASWRIVAVPAHLFEILHSQVGEETPSILKYTASTIVVDENAWIEQPPLLEYPDEFSVEPPDETNLWPYLEDWRCPPSRPCYANPLPPGVVEWKVPNPVASGFSVKPENLSNALACPVLPKQGVDGVYKRGWGCHRALKIPDNCEADLYEDHGVCCCGVLTPLGYICQWIDPTTLSDWPNCYGICVS